MIPVVRCRGAVRFDVIAPGGFRILAAIDALTQILATDVVITSGTDGHTTGRHPFGEAYDLSVRTWTVPMIVQAKSFLERILGSRFTVLYEVPDRPDDPHLRSIAYVNADASAPHLHIQVKKDSVYPPPEPPTAVV